MRLNILSNRSFCNIGQYPVFPLLLKNFNSTFLKLGINDNFRDLSKSMGAAGKVERIKFYEEKFISSEDDLDVPQYHFGSHYSNPASIFM